MLFRLRYFGHPVWKEIEENAEIIWNIYKDMIEKRKVREHFLFQLRKHHDIIQLTRKISSRMHTAHLPNVHVVSATRCQ